MKEDRAGRVRFFQRLRGLSGVKLIVGDKCLGMLEAVGEVFPEAKYRRCSVHFYRYSPLPRAPWVLSRTAALPSYWPVPGCAMLPAPGGAAKST